MTLIAGLIAKARVVFVGDILVTADRLQEDWRDVAVPLAPVVQDHDRDAVIDSLLQKIVIIRPRLCVAWAGPVSDGTKVVAELRSTFEGHEQLDEMQVQTLFEQLARDFPKLQLGISYVSNGTVKARSNNVLNFVQDPIVWGFIGGSGTEHISSEIGRWSNPEYLELWNAGPVALAVEFMAKAMEGQIKDGEGLADRWGGGFEVAYWDGNKFEKLSGVMHSTWSASEKEDGTYALQADPDWRFQYYERDIALFYVNHNAEGKSGQLHVVGAPDVCHSDEESAHFLASIPETMEADVMLAVIRSFPKSGAAASHVAQFVRFGPDAPKLARLRHRWIGDEVETGLEIENLLLSDLGSFLERRGIAVTEVRVRDDVWTAATGWRRAT